MAAVRKFRPTFVVTVTPASVETGLSTKGQPYVAMKDALISRDGHDDIRRTVMAFGKTNDLATTLEAGRPVQLAVQHDEGTLRVVGAPRAAAL